ncbi:hypothetical protein [Chitinophaga sp. OAE865]|uniref:hypothetical protein n=1 Tax=Chitinophaga sp. OAE865 TaxID=2817898 RepID=UPI001AEB7537
MTLDPIVPVYKLICSQEAGNFGISPVLIEILLIKQLYARKNKRHLVSEYLKDSSLSASLKKWNGPFKILNDKSIPTFLFDDGIEIAIRSRRDCPSGYKWDDFIRETCMNISTEAKAIIAQRLKQRLEEADATL